MFLQGGVTDGATFRQKDSRLWMQHLRLLPSGKRTSSVHGLVTDSTGTPISNVEVRAWGTDKVIRTEADGRFTLNDLAPGSHVLQTRLIGYRPGDHHIELGDSDTTVVTTVVIDPLPVRLSDIVIEVEAPYGNRYMKGFAERQRYSATGRFLTMDSYQRRHGEPVHVTEMIHTLRGIRAGRFPHFARCGERPPAYYFDGMFVGGGWDFRINDIISTQWIVAIEAYSGAIPNDHPVAYHYVRGTCGVILIYSRR
jgi:hypothetical protein